MHGQLSVSLGLQNSPDRSFASWTCAGPLCAGGLCPHRWWCCVSWKGQVWGLPGCLSGFDSSPQSHLLIAHGPLSQMNGGHGAHGTAAEHRELSPGQDCPGHCPSQCSPPPGQWDSNPRGLGQTTTQAGVNLSTGGNDCVTLPKEVL